MSSCASGYQAINPEDGLKFNSKDMDGGVSLEYRYNLLEKKYAKQEEKKGTKLVAIKITNNSEKDLVFGQDLKLSNEEGQEIYVLESGATFSRLKQRVGIYALFLLLLPMNFTTTKSDSNGTETNSTPIGLVVAPVIAGGNMGAAHSANNRFKAELMNYDIIGRTIKAGESVTGLVGIEATSFESIKLKIE